MSGHWADDHILYARGPFAVVRTCKVCGHMELIRNNTRGTGRGYGMREGNKARGRMIQHIKTEHPELDPGSN